MERFIISDCINGQPVKSIAQCMTLEQKLQALGLEYAPLIGNWDGVEEQSFLVTCPEDTAIKLGLSYQQEAVASLNANRGFGLVYLEGWDKPGLYVHLGQWECSYDRPALGDYSYSPATNLYLYVR